MDASQFKEFLQLQMTLADDREKQHRAELKILINTITQNQLVRSEHGENVNVVNQGSKAEIIRNLKELIDKFNYDPEHNGTFEKWYERYDNIFTSTADLNDDEKRILILQCLHQTDYNFYRDSIRPSKPHEVTFDKTVEELKRLFSFRETKFSIRSKCFNLVIDESEDYAKYSARINYCAERFDIASCTADDLKILLFLKGLRGTKHEKILEKLLMKVDQSAAQYEALKTQAEREAFVKLTLQTVVNTAERIISIQDDKHAVTSPLESTSINAVHYNNNSKSKPAVNKSVTKPGWSWKDQANRPAMPTRPCYRCGDCHWSDQCSHATKNCASCGQSGHAQGYCDQEQVRKRLGYRFPLNKNQQRQNSDPGRPNLNHICDSSTFKKNRKFVEADINGASIKLQLDTGSDITVISQTNWRILGKPSLQLSNKIVNSASGDSFQLKGRFPCVMKLHGVEEYGDIYVVNHDLNLFGADWIQKFKLWDTAPSTYCNSIRATDLAGIMKSKFPKVFSNDLGCYTKSVAAVTLKEGTRPIYRKARPVPHAALAEVTAELERLQHLGVITPTSYSEWAAPIVVIKKKTGKLRVSGDYSTGLNDALESNHHPLPTADQIFANLAGCTKFSKVDLSDAFWQVPVDNETGKILTINTHLGLFNVNRLQQGVKTAPGIFQQATDTMCSGINAFSFIDDIIVGGTEDTHDAEVFKLFSRIEDYGFNIRLDKCEFGKTKLEFCGHIIDENGITPSPDKLVAIKALPAPSDIHQLRSFLGAANYYGKFVHKMKTLRAPLDKLLEKEVDFVWTSEQQKAFESLKQVLSSDLVLTHYDPKKKIVLATDASQYGMGAVLMHEFADGTLHPVMHWSSTFNAAEKNYPQIQKEARALVFGLRRAYSYIYGRKIEIHIDHKPLLAIFGSKKGIPVYTASRLARYALVVMAFDFTIKYINTESFGYADIVSRLIAAHPKLCEDTVIAVVQSIDDEEDFIINVAQEQDSVLNLGASLAPITFKEVQQATTESSTLQQVIKYIETKWPQKQRQIINKPVAEFFAVRNFLHINQGCIMFNDRLVIPVKLRQKILEELHEGHPGVSRMKLLAANFVYFPHIDELIEKFSKVCETCATTAKAPIKCTLHTWAIPQAPWSRLHIDYAGPIDGNFFLVIVDAYSKWPEILKTKITTSARTIELISEVFSRQGNCDTIVSDNGPQFTSAEFDVFCKSKGIQHIKTAPYNPQSNGQAERFVDTFKRGIKKLSGNIDQKLREFLMNYRRTPSYNLGKKSPAELLNNRQMKSHLDLLKPKTDYHEGSNFRSKRSEAQFNRHHGAKWREFKTNDEVYFKQHLSNDKWQWTPAVVLERLGEVNYKIKIASSDRVQNSHANQLKSRFGKNELLDAFELEDECVDAPMGQVEPTIIPQNQSVDQDTSESDDDVFEEAEENQLLPVPITQSQLPQVPITQAAPAGQRPRRINSGVPAIRYDDIYNICEAESSTIKRGGMW